MAPALRPLQRDVVVRDISLFSVLILITVLLFILPCPFESVLSETRTHGCPTIRPALGWSSNCNSVTHYLNWGFLIYFFLYSYPFVNTATGIVKSSL